MLNHVEFRIQIDGPDMLIAVRYLRRLVGQGLRHTHAVEVPFR